MPPPGPYGYPPPGYPPHGPPGMGMGRYRGRIKTFNHKHGFGFIDCPESYPKYKRDVFIHKAQIGDLEIGEEITFRIEVNKDGHPQSRDILCMDGYPPGRRREGSDDEAKGPPAKKPRRRGGKGRKAKQQAAQEGKKEGQDEKDDKGSDDDAPATAEGEPAADSDPPAAEGAAAE